MFSQASGCPQGGAHANVTRDVLGHGHPWNMRPGYFPAPSGHETWVHLLVTSSCHRWTHVQTSSLDLNVCPQSDTCWALKELWSAQTDGTHPTSSILMLSSPA